MSMVQNVSLNELDEFTQKTLITGSSAVRPSIQPEFFIFWVQYIVTCWDWHRKKAGTAYKKSQEEGWWLSEWNPRSISSGYCGNKLCRSNLTIWKQVYVPMNCDRMLAGNINYNRDLRILCWCLYACCLASFIVLHTALSISEDNLLVGSVPEMSQLPYNFSTPDLH